ncbi:MAG: DNA polymerase IV [Candidatus Bathyarchaeota archaeon]|nr:DNA polymerase IV [Candidatus Bathyarchaeota archaeon]
MEPRVIMLVDLDYFYAQCEERRDPSLRDKPVVVCVYSGRTEESGAVSTANYMARGYGVKSGMPIFIAKRKLKDVDAVFLPMDHAFYEQVSDDVMAILRGFADIFEQVGIDEAYLDATRRTSGSFEAARELAQQLREDVKARENLTCSVGVGPNKLVAKIAADFQKPDGLTVVKPDKVESFLAPLPVKRLMGVGTKIGKRMESLGIKTIGDLAGYDVQEMIEAFGKNLGGYLHSASLGIDEAPVQERGEAESISRISTLKEDSRDLGAISERIVELCRDVHVKVLERNVSFRSVGLIAVLTDMSIRSRSKTLESPSRDLEVLRNTANELAGRLLDEVELEVRRIGVKVSRFTQQEKQKALTDFIENRGR